MRRAAYRSLRSLDSPFAQLGQAAVSLLTTLTFVRILTPTEFGVLTAVWSIWMLLMSMNRTVFGEQLLAQSADKGAHYGYLDFGFFWSSIGVIVTGLIAVVAGMAHLVPSLICVALFVVSDMVRYGEMARRNATAGVKGLLLPLEILRLMLSGVAFLISFTELANYVTTTLALLSALVWVVVGFRVSGVPQFGKAIDFIRRKEKFEGLMVVQFLTGAGASQITPLLALHAFGAAQFGGIRLAQSILSPMTLLSSAFQPNIIRYYASKSGSRGVGKRLLATIAISVAVASAMTLVAWLAILNFGSSLIPASQAPVVHSILLPTIILLSLVVVGQPGGALIKVHRLGGAGLWGQVVGTCATLSFCLLAVQYDIKMFVWALAAGSACTVSGTYLLIAVTLRSVRARPRHRRVADGNSI